MAKPDFLTIIAVFLLSAASTVAAQARTRLLPAEYGYTINTARLQFLYPDAFGALLSAKSAPANPDTMAYCLKVYDGDTYRVRYTITQPDTADTFENIRLDGVECDEILRATVPQPFGQIAADSIRGRILGAYLIFRVAGRDKHNQTVGRAWLDGKDLALLILEKGWGQYIPLNSLDKDTRKAYQKARDRAKKKKLGRWANLDVIDPAQWRAILKK